ncbi:MAG TPA: ArsI/CadI family heavy metal resistance metalloenzyme [Pirellulaceae bacterium]|jgi:catechol 2,3-dioxygenase-like lactoylglutathione lyase family enzyme|nr:ArsI/CadI family heavy metal resistance metalloenzyme [Pirellulaceae bacterium]
MASAETLVRFHLSLNVSDIDRAVAFYSTAFGAEPAKRRADYAKFELDVPPLVLSLEPAAPRSGGAFNHAGFRFRNSEELVALQRRLEEAGVSTIREDGVECCYAKQTKFWLQDPDGNLWEFYVLESDIENRGEGSVPLVGQTDHRPGANGASKPDSLPIAGEDACCAGGACNSSPAAAARRTVRHFLGQPVDDLASAAAGSAHEVFLQGSSNGAISEADERRLLSLAFTATAPGGTLRVHCLTADIRPEGPLELTGPAAVVQRTPVLCELLARIGDAGFFGAELTTYRGGACFRSSGAELRETTIVARKPEPALDHDEMEVVYKGPAAAIVLESGSVLRRGQRARISSADVQELAASRLADAVTTHERNSVTACE